MITNLANLGMATVWGAGAIFATIVLDENTALSWGLVVFLLTVIATGTWKLARWMQKVDDKLDALPCQIAHKQKCPEGNEKS